MQSTIKDVLAARPGLEEDIAAGNYTLYFNNDALIPVQHWDSLIAPGARVTLRIAHSPPPPPPPNPDRRVADATYVPKGASNGRSPHSSRVNGTAPLRLSRVSIAAAADSTDRVDKIAGPAPFRTSKVSLAGDPLILNGQDDAKPSEKPQSPEDAKVRIIDSAGGAYEVPFSLCRSFSVSRHDILPFLLSTLLRKKENPHPFLPTYLPLRRLVFLLGAQRN